MPFIKGNRNDVVRTLTGHTVAIKENEVKYVPDNQELLKACIERGHPLCEALKEQEEEVEKKIQEKDKEQPIRKITRRVAQEKKD